MKIADFLQNYIPVPVLELSRKIFKFSSPKNRILNWKANISNEPSELPLNQLFRIIEKLSYGQSLQEILRTIIDAVEEYRPEIKASVHLLDHDHITLRHGAAPHLPAEYNAFIDGQSIGPSVGSCGTAAYLKKLVIVENIQKDPLWKDYKDMAGKFGLEACWSQPIFSSTGDVLGTFALYYTQPKKPSNAELMLIHSCAYITGIAIERKRSEDLRNESETKYRSLIEQASDAIFLFHQNGLVVDVNISGCRLLGYDKEEILKLNSKEIILSKNLDTESTQFAGLTFGKAIRVERKLMKKDGNVFPADVSLNLISINNQIFLQAIVRDISEQKASEAEIIRLNQTLEKKVDERTNELENANRILSSTNADLVHALQELRTLQTQMMQSEKMIALGQLISGIAHEVNTPLAAILASNENIVSLQEENLLAMLEQFSGFSEEERKIWIGCFHHGSKIPTFLNYSESKKKRKEILSLFRLKNVQEKKILIENLMELDLPIQDLDQALKSKSVSELETIVENAIAFSGIFRSSLIIKEATLKAKRVMTALKTYIYQDWENRPGSINIPEQIDTVLTLYYNTSTDLVKFSQNYIHDSIAWGVSDQISQIWTNLISNSLQAMNFKGKIAISSHIEGEYLAIDIEDNGPGIRPDIQPNIFDSFFTTKGKGMGSGLGLSICKKILDDNGGSINFSSSPGKTVFTVKLLRAVYKEKEEVDKVELKTKLI